MKSQPKPLPIPLETLQTEEKFHDLEAIQKATFNILEDFVGEGEKLRNMQKATFNILEDSAVERDQLQNTQRASLNILDDFAIEKERLEETQKASFNILEDFLEEREKLENLQKAAFNILQDLNSEKDKLEGEIQYRKRAEADLETANKELESFSYSVSHDLRAPLRGIDGFSQALLEDYGDKLDENGRTYLNYVRTSSQQMAQLIDDLLSLSQMSRGEFRRTQINITEIVTSVVANLRKADPNKRIVKVKIAPDLTNVGDARLLRVALENLIGNAWKFTSKKQDALIEFGCKEQEGKPVYFVRDNGAGFDMTYSTKLFGAFQRLHSADEFPGTGVGLATVRRVISRHGGSVWAESKLNVGTTFFFTLN